MNFIIQNLRTGSLEYHKLKSTTEKITKIVIGIKIMLNSTINRVSITPLTVLDMVYNFTYLNYDLYSVILI